MFEIINLILIFSRMAEFPKYFLHFFSPQSTQDREKKYFERTLSDPTVAI